MKTTRTILIAAALLACAAPVLAQSDFADNPDLAPFGLRAGWTSHDSFNQVHLGAHYLFGELFPNFEFTPNVEIGFGDDAVIWAFQGDLAYQFTEFFEKPWGFYGGGSLGFNVFDHDEFESETHLGLSALIGGKYDFASGRQGMVEIRLGVLDSPDFKLTFGTTLF